MAKENSNDAPDNAAVVTGAAALESGAPAPDGKAPPPDAGTPAQAPAVKVRLRSVYGNMIHPYIAMDIRTDADSPEVEIDSWIQSQLDAEKIKVV